MPPALTSTLLPDKRAALAEQDVAAGEDLLRLGHASEARLALGQFALAGPMRSTPRSTSRCTLACVAGCSHIRTFIAGAASTGPGRPAPLRQHAVCESVGELRERVRRQRRDDEQVGLDEMRIEVAGHLSRASASNVFGETNVSASGVKSGVTS